MYGKINTKLDLDAFKNSQYPPYDPVDVMVSWYNGNNQHVRREHFRVVSTEFNASSITGDRWKFILQYPSDGRYRFRAEWSSFKPNEMEITKID